MNETEFVIQFIALIITIVVSFYFEAHSVSSILKVNMLYLSGKVKKLDLISLCLVVGFIIICITLIKSYYDSEIKSLKSETELYKQTLDRLKYKIAMPRYPFATNYERKDYHDYEFMKMEALRDGHGEQGRKVILVDKDEIRRNVETSKKFGFFVDVSDKISVNRSLPDIRLSRSEKLDVNRCLSQQFFSSSLFFKLQNSAIFEATPQSLRRHRFLRRTFEYFASNDSFNIQSNTSRVAS